MATTVCVKIHWVEKHYQTYPKLNGLAHVSSIKHCLTKGHRTGKEMQRLTLQTYDNHALSRNTLKVTHSFFGGQMHTPDLHLRSVIQYPIGSVPKAGVLVFPPSKAAKINQAGWSSR